METKKAKRSNANESLVRRLEALKEAGQRVCIIHSKIKATGIITTIHVGRYRVHIEVNDTLFPVDHSVMKILPVTVEDQNPPPKQANLAPGVFGREMRRAIGIIDLKE